MLFFGLTAVLTALVSTSLASSDCLRQHGRSIAEFSSCGDPQVIASCLLHFRHDNEGYISRCFTSAGCSVDDADSEAILAIRRCKKMRKVKRATTTADSDTASTDDKASTTKEKSASTTEKVTSEEKSTSTTEKVTTKEKSSTKVSSSVPSSTEAESTTDASSSSASSTSVSSASAPTSTWTSGDPMSGTMCFTTHTKMTEYCDVHTTAGRTETATCTEGKALSSECAPGLLCTTDASGEDICMESVGMKTEGIIISIIFGVSAVTIFGYIFFACFRGSRREKAASARGKGKDESTASLIPK